jgi:hypothetical protein
MNETTMKLMDLKSGLQSKDPAFCGEAPSWIIDTVLDNLVGILGPTASPLQIRNDQVASFARGAIKYVADQDASRCDVLLTRLTQLLGDRNQRQ